MEEIVVILKAQLLGLINVLPSLIKAVVIFLVGYILARVLRKLIKRAVELVGLDKLADRLNEIELFQKSGLEFKLSSVLSSIVYYFVLLVFIMTAVEALGMTMISLLLVDFINYIPQAISAFAVLLVGLFLADFVKKIVLATCRSLNISAGNLIANVVFYFIFLNVVLIALRQASLQTEFMENNISVILAGVAGAFAIGYGLASRDIMSNLLASFYNRGRLEVGDEITIGGHRGEIIQMNTNNITLRSDNKEIIVPYHKLTTQGLEIHSRRTRTNTLPPNRF